MIRKMKCALLLLLAFCMLFTGCRREVNSVFEKDSIGGAIRIGVKSETDVFDIDNVTLDLYYSFWDIDYCQKYKTPPKNSYIFADMGDDIIFGMYFCDSESYDDVCNDEFISNYMNIDGHYYVKSISDEEAFTEEYGFQSGKKCNHSEKITIPKEIFSKEKEYLVIKIIGFQEPLTEGGEYYTNRSGYIDLEYRKIDENTVQIDFSPYCDLY